MEYKVFYSEIIGDFSPTVWCLYGRDGVNTSDWEVTMVDDADCVSFSELAVRVKSFRETKSSSSVHYVNTTLILWLAGSVIFMSMLYCLYEVLRWCGTFGNTLNIAFVTNPECSP